MAKAIQGVEGAKVLVQPGRGTGDEALSIAQVEIGGKATLGAVTAALEAAQTPHRAQKAPGVVVVIPGKLKATATPEAIMEALKKADLVAQ